MKSEPRVPYRCAEDLPREALRELLAGEVELAVLFGSVAAGQTHAESDVDIAVWPRGDADLLRLAERIVRVLGTEAVDLVDLRRASGTLQQIVATRGKLVFEDRPGRFASFAAVAERRWQDDLHHLPDLVSSIDRWLEERGA